MGFSAVLDFSGLEAAFAVADRKNNKIFFEKYKEIKGRDSSVLLPWLTETSAEHGISLHEITEWTVGNGPGSFTGLRIAAALIAGMAFGKSEIKTRGMSIALGIAAALDLKDTQECAVIFDGRNNEMVFCRVKKTGENYIEAAAPEIHTADSFNVLDKTQVQTLCALNKDKDILEKLIDAETFAEIIFSPHIHVSKLIFNDPGNWSKNLSDLTYIRPATTAPAISTGK